MDFDTRIRAFKQTNPEVKQLTLRVSKSHAKALKKIAKEKRVKEGVCLRLLMEFAIDLVTGNASQIEKDYSDQNTMVPLADFKALEAHVDHIEAHLFALGIGAKPNKYDIDYTAYKDR